MSYGPIRETWARSGLRWKPDPFGENWPEQGAFWQRFRARWDFHIYNVPNASPILFLEKCDGGLR